MRITTRGRYALRATLALAKLGTDGSPVSISNLSEQEDISPVFLEQIFFKLRKAGVVESVRGPGGGFCFARPLNKVTVRDVLYAAGEDLDLIACEKQNLDCDRVGYCLSHAVWTDVTILINKYFNSITLAQVIENNRICDTGEFDMEEILNGTTGS
ncbi:putative HTH-type transcriptional regulator [Spirochaetia bacterium]|nr:putative HTH-type transcriptional regulator [Spirochaetia bacterium]